MARKLRVEYACPIYHVMNRGDRRELIFMDDVDRQRFVETLGEVCAKTGWQVHASVLMPNHFHWVVETRRSPILSIVPKPVESGQFENHGFAVFLGAFSSGLSASASSFFEWMPRAFNAEQV
jgi:REP element-mobilizing transposase RayT